MKKSVKSQLIFIPAPGVGHIVSTIEFAKSLIQKNDQLFITILIIKMPIIPYTDAYIQSLTASQPNIKLIDLPQIDPPPIELVKISIERYVVELIDKYVSPVRDIVNDINSSRNDEFFPISGIVIDFFCVAMIDIAKELGIPSFIFLTSGSGFLNLMLYLPSRHEQISHEFSISGSDVVIPGFVNPVPVSVLPRALFNTVGGYDAYIKVSSRFKDANGILVHTFYELELYATESLNKRGDQIPPIYPVGPVLNFKGQPHPEMDNAKWEKVMKWLDEQLDKSVVFLCFGSAGGFSVSQVKELALGLEQSGHKFLWSLRVSPFQDEGTQVFKSGEEMLPEGFLERVSGKGIVCGWTPQVEVLAHKAIGGFVSHCGWNSILESIWYGVPIITLPIYAEQQLNAFTMVKELELAVELKLDYGPNSEVIKAEELEKAVKYLMASDCEVRKKVKNMAEIATKTGIEGGSSFNSILKFIKDLEISN